MRDRKPQRTQHTWFLPELTETSAPKATNPALKLAHSSTHGPAYRLNLLSRKSDLSFSARVDSGTRARDANPLSRDRTPPPSCSRLAQPPPTWLHSKKDRFRVIPPQQHAADDRVTARQPPLNADPQPCTLGDDIHSDPLA
ncbi:hypothetical protein L1887_47400 [Cichorium endivia]|nr:hypothetical protein L1887_47400 [Cichorium endivia]